MEEIIHNLMYTGLYYGSVDQCGWKSELCDSFWWKSSML